MLTILFAPLCHICIHISCFQGFGSRQRKEAEEKKRCTEEEKKQVETTSITCTEYVF